MEKYTLDQKNTVLLMIDMQERLMPVMDEKDALLEKSIALIRGAQLLELPILVTEQYPRGLGETVDCLKELFVDWNPHEKMLFSACSEPLIRELSTLRKSKVVIFGIETHICVFQTVRDLLALGYEVFVVEDAVSSRDPKNKRNALNMMAQMGAVVTNVESSLFDLLKKAGSAEFKQISRWIR